MDLDELRERFVGREFDIAEFEVKQDAALEFAAACGETDPRYTDPEHPDYQAPPTFTARFVSRRTMPEKFPRDGFRNSFDGGKAVVLHSPVRVGRKIVAKSQIADIYRKTGRSGAMTFIVHRMRFHDEEGNLLSTVDWRMVQREVSK